MIVEIDESKFGKRKYNRGHHVEGQWIFGGVERTSGNFFLVPVDKRDRETLIPIIQKYILPGTTIISDCWRAYNELKNIGFDHYTVNHSKNFVDPQTGAHTNQIEGLWRHAKHRIPAYRRQNENYYSYLAKFMFISKARKENKEPLIEFLTEASRIYSEIKIDFEDIDANTNNNPFDFSDN